MRLIRGRIEGEPILRRTAFQADTRWCVMNPRALPPVTQSSALQAPECLWRPIRGRKKEGELLDGDVGKERLNEGAGMSDFLL